MYCRALKKAKGKIYLNKNKIISKNKLFRQPRPPPLPPNNFVHVPYLKSMDRVHYKLQRAPGPLAARSTLPIIGPRRGALSFLEFKQNCIEVMYKINKRRVG